MFARVSTIQGVPEKIEEGIRHYRERVLPEARKMTGFKGAYLLVDRKNGKSLGITMWDTENNLQNSATDANKLRTQASKEVKASEPPRVEVYEIVIQT